MDSILNLLNADIRFAEALNACMHCGICTAVCPAAEFYEYDPRAIVATLQEGVEEKIKSLIESDLIWYCGQCMSCKTRCPRGNCPGQLISVLRKVSQQTGAFVKSRKGRQQLLIKRTIGENIIRSGYCITPGLMNPENHPEQGPVWQWIYENPDEAYAVVGANFDGDGPGTLRRISELALAELNQIFMNTGGLELFGQIEFFSGQRALDSGFIDKDDNADMVAYLNHIENEF